MTSPGFVERLVLSFREQQRSLASAPASLNSSGSSAMSEGISGTSMTPQTDGAIDITFKRLDGEEGFKPWAYDDATGKRVKAPIGNLSWLYGTNLETEGTQELGEIVSYYKLGKLHTSLTGFPWYMAAGPVRQSVFLDIAYNAGLQGLLNFPSMIHFASLGEWGMAAGQCHVKNPSLSARYDILAKILATGLLPL
jgi:hypothetical protein